VERETNMLLWSIFGISVITVAIIPSAWGMLGHTASTGAVKNSNMAQTLWGQSTPVSPLVAQMANSESVAIIPGATTPHIQALTWTTTTWGPQLTITGYGFGNPPASGQAALVIADVSRGWTTGSHSVTSTISKWKNDEIDITGFTNYGSSDLTNWANGLGSWVFAPGDSVDVRVTNPQTGAQMSDVATYPTNALMPTISINPITTVIADSTETISGTVNFQGQPLANQAVNIDANIGSFTGNGVQTISTEYTVQTNANGQWTANYLAPKTAGTGTITVMSDAESASATIKIAPPFVVTLTATGNQTNNNITLTATVNYPLEGQFTLSIINQTTGQVVASTTQGTTLSAQISVAEKTTDVFIAQVN